MYFEFDKLKHFPDSPGVYIMKDIKGVVLYVGKANKIRSRVKQYFKKGGDGRAMIPYLIAHVHDVETISVQSEKEALLLENTLIKKHRPKYNVLLKDDKSYIALKINNKHAWPMVQLVRYRGKPKADGLYFGPYTSAHAARQTLDLIHKIFPLRQCSNQELLRRTRPCILYDMKRCIAPCVRKCTKEEYWGLVRDTIHFLKGNDKEVIRQLRSEMQVASDGLEFERAGEILKVIQSIEKTIEGQNVHRPLGKDSDIFGIYREGDEVVLAKMIFRGGALTGATYFTFSKCIQEDDELLASFLMQQYRDAPHSPPQILVPTRLPSPLEEILNLNIITPQKGEKRRLIEMAEANAKAAFNKEHDERGVLERTLIEMQDKLHLSRYPEKIECIDNSNLSGSEAVSALIRFRWGKKDTSGYKKFRLRETAPSDDYGAMKEVLTRRFKKDDLPDLLIIDGGKGHLNMALKVLEELEIVSVDLVGVAKEEGRHDKGATGERVFLPNVKDPVFFKRHSPVLFLIQKIRDEAHRFAITYQKQRRSKLVRKSALDEISGIGAAKKRALLRHFGSLKKIENATLAELEEVPGISPVLAEMIRKHFH